MLEILALYFLCKRNARVAQARGYRGGVFGFVTAAVWVFLELCGFALGVFLELQVLSYLLALAGAGLGALLSVIIVAALPDRSVWIIQPQMLDTMSVRRPAPSPKTKERVWCIQCGKELTSASRICDRCGAQVPTLD